MYREKSEQHSFGDVIGSISVAIIEVEIFTSPLWLGHAITAGSGPVDGYLHAWFFICWGSLALYIGIKRIVRTTPSDEDWPTPNTLLNTLISSLRYNGVLLIGILFAGLLWETTHSFLLVVVFSISSPIWILKCFGSIPTSFDKLAKMGNRL